MILKPCPFCGSEGVGVFTDGTVYCECGLCAATAYTAEAWNTRAAPTMKAWEWAMSSDDRHHTEPTFKAQVTYAGSGLWRAVIDSTVVSSNDGGMGLFSSVKLAKAACVAYVEGKLKEWSV
jgi:hypothetical protein